MTEAFFLDYLPDWTSEGYTVTGVNEYTLFADGTQITASWKGDHEELTDVKVSP